MNNIWKNVSFVFLVNMIREAIHFSHAMRATYVSIVLAIVPNSAVAERLPPNFLGLPSCGDFVSYMEIRDSLEAYQSDYPEIVRYFSIGNTLGEREIPALVLSYEPHVESPEPEMRIIGGIHGDECLSVTMVLELIDWLVRNYSFDAEITHFINNSKIIFIPLLNPDGYSNPTAQRGNLNGVDLNRNLGFGWVDKNNDQSAGPYPFSEPETKAFRDLSQSQNFVLGLSYHTESQYVNGPFNYTPHHPEDAELINDIGNAYAHDSGYWVVFGWDWYTITGDVNDWSLGTQGTLDWTIELRSEHDLEFHIHQQGVRNFMSYAFRGIQGIVTDAQTGEPLEARIEVEPEGVPIFSDPEIGDYHRILLPGTYSITVHAPSYESLSYTDVVIGDENSIALDFALEPLPNGSPEYGFAINQMTIPQVIRNESYTSESYLNKTIPWDALGPPDGLFYSMSPGGSLTLDLGANRRVVDKLGIDLTVVSGSESDDSVVVSLSVDQDGPFVEIGRGIGTFDVDLAASDLSSARFIRLEDDSASTFNSKHAGFDIDAIVNLSPLLSLIPPDGDIDGDADYDADFDEHNSWESRGCSCNTANLKGALSSYLSLLHLLFL